MIKEAASACVVGKERVNRDICVGVGPVGLELCPVGMCWSGLVEGVK